MSRIPYALLLLGLSVSLAAGQEADPEKISGSSSSTQASVSEPASAADQDPESTQPTTQTDADKDVLTIYREKKEQLKKISNDINERFATLSLGLPDVKAEQMKVINSLRQQQKQLADEVNEATIAAYREIGNSDPRLVRDLASYANACYGGLQHNIAIAPHKSVELCELMIEKGLDNRSIRTLAVRASIGILDFERARKHMNASHDAGHPISDQLIDVLTKIEKTWERESTLRSSQGNLPVVEIQTSAGKIVVELFEEEAPETVGNFISLIDSGFYNGKQFFEARRGEFCRTGCPDNQGNGLPGYKVFGESSKEQSRHHFSGTLSMVPYDQKLNCGSQFIITQRPLPHFDDSFTVFGRVTEGMEVVHQIVMQVGDAAGNGQPPVIESVQVLYRRPKSTYVPNKVLDR